MQARRAICILWPRVSIALASCLVLSGCTSVDEPAIQGSPGVAISFTGFYNSETSDFSPERIGYSALVNYRHVFQSLSEGLSNQGYNVKELEAVEEMADQFTADDIKLVKKILNTVLSETNNYLRNGSDVCVDCSDLKFPAPHKYSNFKEWGDDDRLILFAGLETLSPYSLGLESGLSAVVFDGSGKYVGMSVVRYDFTNYNSEVMIENCKALINKLLRSNNSINMG